MDIYATDTDNKKYNIEIQRKDKGAGAKRARYNSSVIDSNAIPAGSDVENLPETFVIFITENDVFGKDKSIYHINRYIEETGEYFQDDSHIIYVNASTTEDSPIGLLMHDFRVTNANEMHNKVLANTVRHFKEDEEGVKDMSGIIEELVEELAEERNIEVVENLLRLGTVSITDISKATGLSEEQVLKIKEEMES